MSSKSENIIKLNNTNYYSWKFKMEMILIKEDVWETVTTPAVDVPIGTRAVNAWRKNDRKAKALIGLNVEDDQLVYIRNCATARDAWQELKKAHEKGTIVNKVLLFKKISQKRLKEGGNLPRHINDLNEMFQQLIDISGDMAQEWKVGILLGSLPKSYDNLITALEVRPEAELTWSLVQSKLIDQYYKLEQVEKQDEQNLGVAMYTGTKPKFECFFCKGSHKLADCEKFKLYKEFEDYTERKKNWRYKEGALTAVFNDTSYDEDTKEIKYNENSM